MSKTVLLRGYIRFKNASSVWYTLFFSKAARLFNCVYFLNAQLYVLKFRILWLQRTKFFKLFTQTGKLDNKAKVSHNENEVVAICLCFVILTPNQIQYGAFKRARTVKKWRHDSSSSRILCLLFLWVRHIF